MASSYIFNPLHNKHYEMCFEMVSGAAPAGIRPTHRCAKSFCDVAQADFDDARTCVLRRIIHV